MRNPVSVMAVVGGGILILSTVLLGRAASTGQESTLEERLSILERKVAFEERLSLLELKVAKLEEMMTKLTPQSNEALQNRISDLERKLSSLEGAPAKQTPPSDGSLQNRISDLERRLSSLEGTLAKLTQDLAESDTLPPGTVSIEPPGPASPYQGNWRAPENWRTYLKRGMTEDQVQELMGKPDKIEKMALIGKIWYYGGVGGGSVSFTTKGRVRAWLEPPPNQLK